MVTWNRSSACTGGACVEVAWKTSSFCANGACVEVGWKASSFCSSGGCVEASHRDGMVLVRDSKLGDGSPVLSFPPSSWLSDVLAPVLLDRLPRTVGVVTDMPDGVDIYEWDGHTVDGEPTRLRFTDEEWEAFRKGVEAGEFDLPVGALDG